MKSSAERSHERSLYHHFTNKLELYRASGGHGAQTGRPMESRPMRATDKRLEARAGLSRRLPRLDADTHPCHRGARGAWVEGMVRSCPSTNRGAGRPPRSDRRQDTTGEKPLEMAHVLLGALNTAARVIAASPDPATARLHVEPTIERLLRGLGY